MTKKKPLHVLWVEALESDRYPQGRGQLRTKVGFCCLGVGCDIYNPKDWREGSSGYIYNVDHHDYHLDVEAQVGMTEAERREWYRLKIASDPIYAIADAHVMGRLHEIADDERRHAIGVGVIISTGLGSRGWALQSVTLVK